MKPLYYSALAPPQVAPALAAQAHESLRPVIAYLNAAKAAAKEREVRSRCHWTAVPVERTIQLRAVDSLFEVAGELGGYAVVGWSGPAPSMPLFVGAQFRPVLPVRVNESGGRVVVWLAEVLAADEQVFWAGVRCQLLADAPAFPANVVARRQDGRSVLILDRKEVGGALRIVVDGHEPVTLSNETGAPISHRVLPASVGATRLRGDRTEIEWNGEHELQLAPLPDTPTLLADNGVRWTWQERVETSRRRRGVWIQLLAPDDPDEIQADSTIDARAAFCDEGVREVRTKKGGNKGDEFRVFGFRRDTYRLELDRLPPEGSTLFLPSKLAGLNRQLNAVYRLKDSPLPHHRGLLTLCEDPTKVRWPDVRPEPVTQWHLLADDQWDGTVEQREFVSKALATNDFAFLEGPPGSGKTHAICELVLQFVERQQRVLLCSTTHVAVDNVLERLITKFPQIEAIRVGLSDRVDPRVRSCQLDERVERLAASWKSAGAFSDLDDQQLDAAAESIVLAGANLTCGTTTGILSHPYIRRVDAGEGPSWPHFDVLIIDEASKTTFQEFLVPAQLARTWIIVGDVRQLPPFTDPRDLEASLADVSDEAQRRFPPAWQRACLLRFKLSRPEAGAGRICWLIEESAEVLDALVSECAHTAQGASTPMIARIVERATRPEDVTVRDLETGQAAALRLAAADWVLVPRGLRSRVERYLPAHLLPCSVAGDDEAARFRRAHWLNATGRLQPPVRDGNMQHATAADVVAALQEFFGEQTWASQVAWRLGRVHQLASARNDQNRLRRQAEVDALMPNAPEWRWVETATDAIRDVGVRSVIESLRVRRVDHRVRRKSALTEAIPDWVWKARAVLLTYQHRMHRDISALPRELFYEKTALRDANTLTGRDAKVGWNFLTDAGGRRVWLDVAGTEERGVNRQEVTAMEDVLRRWVASAPPRRADGQPWEIACLSFYSRQELAIRDMLRRLTGQQGAETRFALPNAALVGGTVDRFQGREADMVLLSLRNTRRTGHLDSPNRLNVAITRARFMLVIIGHRSYFTRCPSEELAALAAQSPVLALGGRR